MFPSLTKVLPDHTTAADPHSHRQAKPLVSGGRARASVGGPAGVGLTALLGLRLRFWAKRVLVTCLRLEKVLSNVQVDVVACASQGKSQE